MLAALSLVAVATGAPVATSNLPEAHAQQLFTGLAKAHAQHLTKVTPSPLPRSPASSSSTAVSK